eukprot:2976995-Amphidinium_carterae.1
MCASSDAVLRSVDRSEALQSQHKGRGSISFPPQGRVGGIAVEKVPALQIVVDTALKHEKLSVGGGVCTRRLFCLLEEVVAFLALKAASFVVLTLVRVAEKFCCSGFAQLARPQNDIGVAGAQSHGSNYKAND